MTATATTIRTLGDLKAALRDASAVYVRADFSDSLTEFVEVSAKALLRALSVDAATGEERPYHTPVRAVVSDGELFVSGPSAFPERPRSRPASPPAPTPSVAPAAPVARPAKPSVHEFDLSGDPPVRIRFAAGMLKGSGVLVAKSRDASVSYTVVEIPTDWAGRSFHLAKLPGAVGDDKQNASYSVFLAASSDPGEHHCDCKGKERWGACKHTAALAELLQRGAI